ncbi:EAL domain-containing protein [Photobacterium nomapromontoriensis]
MRLYDKSIEIEDYIKSIEKKDHFDISVLAAVLSDVRNSFPVSINISIKSLESQYFITNAIFLLKNSKITLEVTEHDHDVDLKLIQKNMLKLKNKTKVIFSLDDFGKGSSNTERLMALPFDVIKIDRCMVRNIANNYSDFAVLKLTIHKLVNILKKEIIIEGVEEQLQVDLINLIGSYPIQGYYYSKPISLEAITNKEIDTILGTTVITKNNAIEETNALDIINEIIYNITTHRKISDIDISKEIYDLLSIRAIDAEIDVLNKAKNFIPKSKSISSLYASSIINGCNNMVIIRDSSGKAIFNNDKHIEYFGMDIVNRDVNNLFSINPYYEKCINLDCSLLESRRNILLSNETLLKNNKLINVEVLRQKITHNNNEFILCIIYDENSVMYIDNTILNLPRDTW